MSGSRSWRISPGRAQEQWRQQGSQECAITPHASRACSGLVAQFVGLTGPSSTRRWLAPQPGGSQLWLKGAGARNWRAPGFGAIARTSQQRPRRVPCCGEQLPRGQSLRPRSSAGTGPARHSRVDHAEVGRLPDRCQSQQLCINGICRAEHPSVDAEGSCSVAKW